MQEKKTLRPSPTALLNPRLDPNFKAIFTQETKGSYKALQSFLSSILGRKIKDVSLTANEPTVDMEDQMQMSFDVSVIFDNGEKASIEMQGRSQDYSYETRCEIQVARLLNNNAKKSENWQSEKVYQISVLNFHLPEHDKKEITWYNMRDETGQVLSGHLNVIFIDLLVIKKLIGKPVKELTALQKWGLYLSYADDERYTDYIKQLTSSEEGIMEADLIIGKMSEDDANWFRQNSIDIARRDRNTIIHNAEKRGLEKGLKKGMQQGMQQGMQKGLQQALQQTAENMLKKHYSISEITELTGLSLEEVKKIAAN